MAGLVGKKAPAMLEGNSCLDRSLNEFKGFVAEEINTKSEHHPD